MLLQGFYIFNFFFTSKLTVVENNEGDRCTASAALRNLPQMDECEQDVRGERRHGVSMVDFFVTSPIGIILLLGNNRNRESCSSS